MFEKFIKINDGYTVNFRKGPNTSYESVTYLKPGTVIQVLEEITGTTWYRGKLEDGLEGYVTNLAKYVTAFEPDWLTKNKAVIEIANSYLGTPYVYGSKRMDDVDFDCSDLTQYAVFKATGLKIHAASNTQAKDGVSVPVKIGTLRTGDLLIMDTNKDGIVNHVGFYVYPNKLLHTYSTKADVFNEDGDLVQKGTGGVTWSDFYEGSLWFGRTVDARRVVE